MGINQMHFIPLIISLNTFTRFSSNLFSVKQTHQYLHYFIEIMQKIFILKLISTIYPRYSNISQKLLFIGQ